MIVSFQNINFILIGIIILLALLGVRYLAILISTYKGGFEKDDMQTMMVLMPRGLAAAILAIKFGPEFVNRYMPGSDDFFKDVAFVVILGTAIITTVGVSIICHYEMKKINYLEIQKPESTLPDSSIEQEN
jgi:NhaP-type Na+/H+ or K+/H+ antiporter